MNPAIQWASESQPLTKSSVLPEHTSWIEPRETTTSQVKIYAFEIRAVPPGERPGHRSVDDVVTEFEAEPEMAAAMAAARSRLASVLAPERPMLHHLRLRAGLSQKAVADLIGTSQPRLSLIEQGKTEPGFTVVEKLVSALKCSRDELADALQRSLEAAR